MGLTFWKEKKTTEIVGIINRIGEKKVTLMSIHLYILYYLIEAVANVGEAVANTQQAIANAQQAIAS